MRQSPNLGVSIRCLGRAKAHVGLPGPLPYSTSKTGLLITKSCIAGKPLNNDLASCHVFASQPFDLLVRISFRHVTFVLT